jgi:UDP-MurNAc hydroxylase
MRITSLGHAGMLIATRDITILCDPWFEPAFFGSWFPFPRNDQLASDITTAIENPNYLYKTQIHGENIHKAFHTNHDNKETL